MIRINARMDAVPQVEYVPIALAKTTRIDYAIDSQRLVIEANQMLRAVEKMQEDEEKGKPSKK